MAQFSFRISLVFLVVVIDSFKQEPLKHTKQQFSIDWCRKSQNISDFPKQFIVFIHPSPSLQIIETHCHSPSCFSFFREIKSLYILHYVSYATYNLLNQIDDVSSRLHSTNEFYLLLLRLGSDSFDSLDLVLSKIAKTQVVWLRN